MGWFTTAVAVLIGLAQPRSAHAATDPEVGRLNLAGVAAGVEATPLASAYYRRTTFGLWRPGAETEATFSNAVLTGVRGLRLRVERAEPVWLGQRYALLALVGTGVSYGHDAGGSYGAWSALLGAHVRRTVGHWRFGLRVAYLPVITSHIGFSGSVRDSFADRYPDDRTGPGSASATVWLGSQRAQALLTAQAVWEAWVLDVAGGVQWAPWAGREGANLDFGQLPILLRAGMARRF